MTAPFKDKDDLWAEFQQKSGLGRHVISGKALAAMLALVLLVIAAFAVA